MGKPINGRAKADTLVTVQTGKYAGRKYTIRLETSTAAAYKRAKAKGHLTIPAPLGGYRSITAQANLKARPSEYGSDLPSASIGAPGTSTHGWGDCVDIGENNAWFADHCHEYGFVRESPAGEDNHYRFLKPTWKKYVPPLKPTQRKAKQDTHVYMDASKKKAFEAINKNHVFDLVGYVHGESVDGNDVWFKTSGGHYVSAARTTSKATTGLKNLTPKKVEPVKPTTAPSTVATTPAPVDPIVAPKTIPVPPELTPAETAVVNEPVKSTGFIAWLKGLFT